MGISEVIQGTPSLSSVTGKTLERLVNASRMRSLQRGEYVWHAGDCAEVLTIIRTGLIKVTKSAGIGRQSICGLFGAPDTVGDAAVFRGIPYPADAQVITGTASVVEVARTVFLSVVEVEPQIGLSCTRAAQGKILALHAKIGVLSAGTVEIRLAQLLLDLYERFGDELDDDTGLVPIALSRGELAALVATSFETVIRIMTRWERDAIVETASRGFIIRQEAVLQRLVLAD